MDFQQFKTAVIARCAELGVTEYELYYQAAESVSCDAFQHEISEFKSSSEGGVCLRCVWGGRMGYASTESLTAAGARALVDRAVDNASVLESDDPVLLAEGGQTYGVASPSDCAMPETDALVARVLQVQEQLYASDSAVVDGCQTEALAERSKVAICNSRGLDLSYETVLSGLVAVSVVSDGKEMANEYAVKLGNLETIDSEALTKKATSDALRKLGGGPAPTGKYPVFFSPEAMSDLLATFCAVFSSENVQKGLSRLKDKEGSVIASPMVTLVDDPFYPGSPLQRPFDAEGSPTHRKNVIEGGVLKTLLYNLKTAAVAGKQTTGNASKSGYDAPVAVRPFTMYLVSGTHSREELLSGVEQGVLINSLGGLHAGANPITGDFSLQSAGFLVENGVLTESVKSFTVAGNFYDLLKNITALASDLETPGMGSFGSPTVRVDGLTIAGK
ncbi:MAG: TldD/PmbA family protein [Faecousia sp.]